MPKISSHPRVVAAAQAIGGQRTKYSIEGVTGLILECAPEGGRAWFARYQVGHGRQGRRERYHRLGSFERDETDYMTLGQAKDATETLRSQAREGRDPFAEARPEGGLTFADLFTDWLENYAKQNRKTWPQDEARWRQLISPRLGKRAFAEIKRSDVVAMTDSIARKATGIQANRCQSLVSAVFGWAVARGRLETTPAYKLPKAVKEKPRDRVMSEEEIRTFWQSVGAAPLGLRMERILRIILLTGQRRSEVALAQRSELTLKGARSSWSIPGTRTKNEVAQIVPLPRLAARLFSEACADSKSSAVFPAKSGLEGEAIAPLGVTRAMGRLGQHLARENWPTVHDMRRTVGTELAKLGVPETVISSVLNHTLEGVTNRVYIVHRYETEKRRALRLWQLRLQEIVRDRKPRGLHW